MEPALSIVDRLRRWDTALSNETTDLVVDRLLTVAPFCDMDPGGFPRSVPLRELLKNDTCVRRYRKGEVVVNEGEYGTSAFMVLDGSVQAVLSPHLRASAADCREPRRRGFFRALAQLWTNAREDEVARKQPRRDFLRQAHQERLRKRRIVLQDIPRVLNDRCTTKLERGEFFGENAALLRTPRTATIIARDDHTELLEIRWQGLRDLMRYDPRLRQHIDRLYRERALISFLAEMPFMQHLSAEARQRVAESVQLETYGDHDWSGEYKNLLQSGGGAANEPVIASEGDYPNGVVVIRAGFARVTQRYGNGHRTLNYLGAGHLYGFQEIAHNWRSDRPTALQHTLRVIGYVHLLVIPTAIFEEVVLPSIPKDELPPLCEEPVNSIPPFKSAGEQPAGAREPWTRPLPTGATVKPGIVEFLTQNRFGNGRETMVIDMDRCTRCDDCVRACAVTHDNNPRFLRHGPIHENLMVAQACMHCIDPVCMIGCPTGAIHREGFGSEVVIDPTTCIGCSMCANNCPYGAIRMVETRNGSGALLVASDARPILKATKCDLCVDQPAGPACVRACPHDALGRLNLNTPDALVQWLQR